MRSWVEMDAKARDRFVTIKLDVDDYIRLDGKSLSLGSHKYAQTFQDGVNQLLHRWILGLRTGDRRIGDHRNGDPNDYRRSNLRIVTPSGSSQNVAGRGKSKFRGVHPVRSGRWTARVKFQGRVTHIGTYTCELDAARAADIRRRQVMPEYVPRAADMATLYGPAMEPTGPSPAPFIYRPIRPRRSTESKGTP